MQAFEIVVQAVVSNDKQRKNNDKSEVFPLPMYQISSFRSAARSSSHASESERTLTGVVTSGKLKPKLYSIRRSPRSAAKDQPHGSIIGAERL